MVHVRWKCAYVCVHGSIENTWRIHVKQKMKDNILQNGNGDDFVQKIKILTKDVVRCLDKNEQERWRWTLIARIGEIPKGPNSVTMCECD